MQTLNPIDTVVVAPPVAPEPLLNRLSGLVEARRARRRLEAERARNDWVAILRRRAYAEEGDAERLLEIARWRYPKVSDEELEDRVRDDAGEDTRRLNSEALLVARLERATADLKRYEPAMNEAVNRYKHLVATHAEPGDIQRAMSFIRDREQDREGAVAEHARAARELAEFRSEFPHLFV